MIMFWTNFIEICYEKFDNFELSIQTWENWLDLDYILKLLYTKHSF